MSTLRKFIAVFDEGRPRGRESVSILEAVRRMAAARKKASALKPARDEKKKSRKKKMRVGKKAASAEKKATKGGGGGQSQHNPFKRSSTLGPTTVPKTRPPAPPPRRTRVSKETGCWSCKKTSAYNQRCVGRCKKNRGKVVEIKIDREYKQRYNKAFKRHRTMSRAGKGK